jgi:hypothetical protein
LARQYCDTPACRYDPGARHHPGIARYAYRGWPSTWEWLGHRIDPAPLRSGDPGGASLRHCTRSSFHWRCRRRRLATPGEPVNRCGSSARASMLQSFRISALSPGRRPPGASGGKQPFLGANRRTRSLETRSGITRLTDLMRLPCFLAEPVQPYAEWAPEGVESPRRVDLDPPRVRRALRDAPGAVGSARRANSSKFHQYDKSAECFGTQVGSCVGLWYG